MPLPHPGLRPLLVALSSIASPRRPTLRRAILTLVTAALGPASATLDYSRTL